MAHKMVTFDRWLKKAVFMFVCALAVLTLATAFAPSAHACLYCYQDANDAWHCNSTLSTASDVCVISPTGCTGYFDCICVRNCSVCNPNCPADWKGPIAQKPVMSCSLNAHKIQAALRRHDPRVIQIAATEPQTDDEKLALFLGKIDAGEFSSTDPKKPVTVYIQTDSALAAALMGKITVNRWKSFLVGFETEAKTGKQQKVYYIETKKGRKVHIVLLDPPTADSTKH